MEVVMLKRFYIVLMLLFFVGPVFATPMTWTETANFVHKGSLAGQFNQKNNFNYSLYAGLYGETKHNIIDGGFILHTGDWEGVSFHDFNKTNLNYTWTFDDISTLNKSRLIEIAMLSLTGDHYLDAPKYYASGVNMGGAGSHGAVVPEPSTVILLGSGILGLVWCVRNRKRV
jgi:hypothetical protein